MKEKDAFPFNQFHLLKDQVLREGSLCIKFLLWKMSYPYVALSA